MSVDMLADWANDEEAMEGGHLIAIRNLEIDYQGFRVGRMTRHLLKSLQLNPKEEDGAIDQGTLKLAVQAIVEKLNLSNIGNTHGCTHLGFVICAVMGDDFQGWILYLLDTVKGGEVIDPEYER